MIRRFLLVLLGCSAVVGAQTHKVAQPQTVVRAVGVYEWTGDIAKPTASRLIPVTMFIDGNLQDAGVYLARPVPFALQTGNLYELQQSGLTKGSLELSYARHLQMVNTETGATAYDDGWFGYGVFKAPPAEKKAPVLKASAKIPEITTSGKKAAAADDGRPHFSNKGADDKAADKSADAGTSKPDKDADAYPNGRASTSDGKISDPDVGGASTPAGDPERPTLHRRDDSAGNGSGDSKSKNKKAPEASVTDSAPVDDPDRPKLSKKPASTNSDGTVAGDVDGGTPKPSGQGGSGDSSASSGSGGANSGGSSSKGTTTTSSDDSDRPTLKRRTPEEARKQQEASGRSTVTGAGVGLEDPNRPTIKRGKPANAMNEDDLPKLKGLPVDMKQMVAVSDAVNRESHNFGRPWESDTERTTILAKMQALARAKLAAYEATNAAASASAAASVPTKPAATVKKPAVPATAAARRKAAATVAAPAPVALLDEDLKGYVLSYGGAPTYVYMAHTAAGVSTPVEYVTVVAQADAFGEVKPAIQSVTDAAHLDRTPRLRLVDVVDVEASNRASLLFELREQQSRQFALYRVIGAKADQTFTTGTTQ